MKMRERKKEEASGEKRYEEEAGVAWRRDIVCAVLMT